MALSDGDCRHLEQYIYIYIYIYICIHVVGVFQLALFVAFQG